MPAGWAPQEGRAGQHYLGGHSRPAPAQLTAHPPQPHARLGGSRDPMAAGTKHPTRGQSRLSTHLKPPGQLPPCGRQTGTGGLFSDSGEVLGNSSQPYTETYTWPRHGSTPWPMGNTPGPLSWPLGQLPTCPAALLALDVAAHVRVTDHGPWTRSYRGKGGARLGREPSVPPPARLGRGCPHPRT